jgi:hypothetical protein
MEKIPESFPYHGKIRRKFSIPWKTFFHTMEKSGRGPAIRSGHEKRAARRPLSVSS